jgi:TPR repeat protein
MTSIGDMYRDGLGIDRDWEQADAWYKKAAEAGDIYAQVVRGDIKPEHALMLLGRTPQRRF